MLILESPLDAYRADLAAIPERESFGTGDATWLLIAHLVRGLAHAPASARPERAQRAASVLRAFGADDPPETEDSDEATRRNDVAVALASLGNADGPDRLGGAVQCVVEREEEAGALHLAVTTLHLLRPIIRVSTRAEGLVVAQMGRVARQLGDLDSAGDLYQDAEALGRAAGALDVQLRAALGRGVVANMRGNYPEARAIFGRVLQRATRPEHVELVRAAHHGLLHAASAANDVDAALQHGWQAFQHVRDDPVQCATMLVSIAELCARAGYHAAALRASSVAARLTVLARIRLPALGGAAVSAARLEDLELLEQLTAEAIREISQSPQPFENAGALLDLAEAWITAGDANRAGEYLVRARADARAGGYFEILYRAEQLAAPEAVARPSAPRELSGASREIVRSVEELSLERATT